jgi:hypothetical protein
VKFKIDRAAVLFSVFFIVALAALMGSVHHSGDTVYHPDIREVELKVDSVIFAADRPTHLVVFLHFTNRSPYPIRVDDPAVGAKLIIRGKKIPTIKRTAEYVPKIVLTDQDLFERLVFNLSDSGVAEGETFSLVVDGAAVGAESGKFLALVGVSAETNSNATYIDH